MAIWEFAPGSPWNAIFMVLVMFVFLAPCISRSAFRQYVPGGFEIGGGVDAAGHRVHDGDVDPHPGLERSELLEFFLLLQRRGGQRNEALQRRTAIGIKADMMVARPLAPRDGGAGKIKRAQPPCADRRADRLHYVRVGALFLGMDFGGK